MTHHLPLFSLYYQAHIRRSDCWYFTAILRSFEYLTFDRTLDVQESIFEFFVTPEREEEFQALMARLAAEGVVSNLTKLPNRLLGADQEV